MLVLENINFALGNGEDTVKILKGINLKLEKGKMYALTGPNGGGKTTIARIIMGINQPNGGKVIFNGQDITSLGITERARLGIGYAFQQPPRFKGMRVADMLEIATRGSKLKDCLHLRKTGLCPEDYLDRTLDNTLSGGEVKRIEIATLLALDPKMRIFDEPEAGIDLWSFTRLIEVIGSSHNKDKTTVIISHQEKILNMVDEIILVDDGKIVLKGDKKTVWPKIKDSVTCDCRKTCLLEGEIYADCPR
ncbi:MAG TPA: ATP-binding cassette domain-containing protein [Firmicutes bacterium]|nr:ATP-binding cassette domain-containing protein [Bacillota bacterium]